MTSTCNYPHPSLDERCTEIADHEGDHAVMEWGNHGLFWSDPSRLAEKILDVLRGAPSRSLIVLRRRTNACSHRDVALALDLLHATGRIDSRCRPV